MDFRIVTSIDFKNHSWHEPDNFEFASRWHLIPLYGPEAQAASVDMPLAITQSRFGWKLVAVCGLRPNQNAFVQQGAWTANYQPVFLTHYPFAAGEDVDGKAGLVFDVDSGLLDEKNGGFPFFSPIHDLVGKSAKRLEDIRPYKALREETRELLSILADAGAVRPWPADLQHRFDIAIPELYILDIEMVKRLDTTIPLMRNAEPLAMFLQQSLDQVSHLADRTSSQHF